MGSGKRRKQKNEVELWAKKCWYVVCKGDWSGLLSFLLLGTAQGLLAICR